MLSPDQYNALVVSYKNGAPVRLSDVGSVVGGVENDRVAGWYNGKPAVILDIQRQPGANIVATVAAIRDALPALQRSIPAQITMQAVTDRTETIRASVADVEFTLVLAIGLVVFVIYLFLRSARATLIPAVALPLSLIGTFGVMALCGYSLDNLSLMALTVATGFVVDDAIVMIENVVRFIEEGYSPLEAAYRGARQIGFTIVSLTVSLVAVFIPLLFMTGVVGRLFNEFAVVLSTSVIVSAVVSLTLTPMMCGRLLRREEKPGWLTRWFERGFDWSAGVLSPHADGGAALPGHHPAGGRGHAVRHGGALSDHPQGLSAAAGYRRDHRGYRGGAERIDPAHAGAADPKLAQIARQDPAVAGVASFVGAGSINATPNTGRLTIALKPRPERGNVQTVVIARSAGRRWPTRPV